MMKPYIICHMMASLDGRIDCDMTEQIGSLGYYEALAELKTDSSIEGRVTAAKHYAEDGSFRAGDATPIGREEVYRSMEGTRWEAVCDTHGTLLWPEDDDINRLCLLSEDAPREYADYLRRMGTSYIATGKGGIDLLRATELMARDFDAHRIVVAGGGHINGAFLKAGLIDEVSMVYGAAIDGREGFACAFDGIEPSHATPYMLHLESVRQMDDDSVWMRYTVR